MKDLVDPQTNHLDLNRIQDLFPQQIATEILKVLILSKLRPNAILWEAEKNVVYSVRSAYRLLTKLRKTIKAGQNSMEIERSS